MPCFIASTKNLNEGSVDTMDATKWLRGLSPSDFEKAVGYLPKDQATIKHSLGMVGLGREAFDLVARGGYIREDMAAIVGARLDDPDQQMAALREFHKNPPTSQQHAHLLLDTMPFGLRSEIEETGSLGFVNQAEQIADGRARGDLMNAMTNEAARNKKASSILLSQGDTIEGWGTNRLDTEANTEVKKNADALLYQIRRQANSAGSAINEAIRNGSAKLIKAKGKERKTLLAALAKTAIDDLTSAPQPVGKLRPENQQPPAQASDTPSDTPSSAPEAPRKPLEKAASTTEPSTTGRNKPLNFAEQRAEINELFGEGENRLPLDMTLRESDAVDKLTFNKALLRTINTPAYEELAMQERALWDGIEIGGEDVKGALTTGKIPQGSSKNPEKYRTIAKGIIKSASIKLRIKIASLKKASKKASPQPATPRPVERSALTYKPTEDNHISPEVVEQKQAEYDAMLSRLTPEEKQADDMQEPLVRLADLEEEADAVAKLRDCINQKKASDGEG